MLVMQILGNTKNTICLQNVLKSKFYNLHEKPITPNAESASAKRNRLRRVFEETYDYAQDIVLSIFRMKKKSDSLQKFASQSHVECDP